MITIYKYTVPITNFDLELPKDAEILAVQAQYNEPQMWVLLNTDKSFTVRHFTVCGTGHQVELIGSHKYIGTFQLHGGSFVGHLFEENLGRED